MRPAYSATVLGDNPQLRAIARPDWPAWSFSLMISRSFRIGSLSAAIPPPCGGGMSGGLPSGVNAPERPAEAGHLAMRSAIGLLRNR